ncbi:MAG: hypothetical protein V4543_00365 [Bacteroidota bacterium]
MQTGTNTNAQLPINPNTAIAGKLSDWVLLVWFRSLVTGFTLLTAVIAAWHIRQGEAFSISVLNDSISTALAAAFAGVYTGIPGLIVLNIILVAFLRNHYSPAKSTFVILISLSAIVAVYCGLFYNYFLFSAPFLAFFPVWAAVMRSKAPMPAIPQRQALNLGFQRFNSLTGPSALAGGRQPLREFNGV